MQKVNIMASEEAESMDRFRYELLKCGGCGKTLGYIYVSVKVFPPEGLIHLKLGGPIIKIEKDVFCKECFEKRKTD